ncbi:MAG: GxxExxY protein [Planctomyces sp.]|nr:GxxExxY protein [Planctomyces sp.]
MALLFEDETYPILGACFEVYKEKGCGFFEKVYHECLELEFELQGIPFFGEAQHRLFYKGRQLNQSYVADFICCGKVIVEVKALAQLSDDHRAQVHNYLKATDLRVGLLVNFGHYPRLEYERIIR